jgi:hypothetical protein
MALIWSININLYCAHKNCWAVWRQRPVAMVQVYDVAFVRCIVSFTRYFQQQTVALFHGVTTRVLWHPRYFWCKQHTWHMPESEKIRAWSHDRLARPLKLYFLVSQTKFYARPHGNESKPLEHLNVLQSYQVYFWKLANKSQQHLLQYTLTNKH